jgi:hypothetical protein
VCAPAHAQTITAPLIVGLVETIRNYTYTAARQAPGGQLWPPLRLVLDKAANIAPIPFLPQLASEAGGQGLQLTPCSKTSPKPDGGGQPKPMGSCRHSEPKFCCQASGTNHPRDCLHDDRGLGPPSSNHRNQPHPATGEQHPHANQHPIRIADPRSFPPVTSPTSPPDTVPSLPEATTSFFVSTRGGVHHSTSTIPPKW